MKKIIIAIVVVLVLAGSGAAYYKFVYTAAPSTKDMIPEALLPQDSSVVITIDHSNAEQMKLFWEIMDRIPTTGKMDDLIALYDSKAQSPFKYAEISDLINSDWKLVMAVKYSGDPKKLAIDIQDPAFDPIKNGIEPCIVGKFEQPDKVQTSLDNIVKTANSNLEFLKDEKNPTWRMKKDDFEMWITRIGDIYFQSFGGVAQRDAVLQRIKDGNGFDKSPKYLANMKLLGEKNLGYIYLDGKLMMEMLKEGSVAQVPGTVFPPYFDEIISLTGDAWIVVSADTNGIKLTSKYYNAGDKALWDKYYPDYQVSLINKVPSDGVIAYVEMPTFDLYLESFLSAFSQGFYAGTNMERAASSPATDTVVDPATDSPATTEPVKKITRGSGYKSTTVPVAIPEVTPPVTTVTPPVDQTVSGNLYTTLIEQLAGISGLTGDDVKKIFDSPFAFSFSDTGSLMPAFGLYIKVNQESLENAKKLVAATSTYADQSLLALNGMLKSKGIAGIIKKEIKTVDGAAIQKIYVDWSLYPAQTLQDFTMEFGMDPSQIKIEFYYGVTSDGVLVLALYPDFTDMYGKNTIADAGYFKEMRTDVGEVFGNTLGFVRTAPLLSMIDRFVQLAIKITGEYTDVPLTYEMYTKIISSFKYLVGSSLKEADGFRGVVSIKIEKVEFSPELKQKLEAEKAAEKQAKDALDKVQQEMDTLPIDSPTVDTPTVPPGSGGL